MNHTEYYDMVYIISLRHKRENKMKSIQQLKENKFNNFKFIDAVNGKDIMYQNLYKAITKDMTDDHIRYNFSKGALGCLLSHIKCCIDAKENNYKRILVLEDDFLIIEDYNEKFVDLMQNVDENSWDLLYLGKKQDGDIQPGNENDKIYKANKFTYATHALLIKEVLFESIIQIATKNVIRDPIDIALFTLHEAYNFFAVKEDLFITNDYESDIQYIEKSVCNIKKWNWNQELYRKIETMNIEKIIIFGFNRELHHTHAYIHKMYFEHILYYFPMVEVYHLDEKDETHDSFFENSVVFASPTHVHYDNFYGGSSTFYIFHLDDYDDNVGYKTIQSFFEDSKIENFLEKINHHYIILTCREQVGGSEMKYFSESIESKMICLPWFANETYHDLNRVDRKISEKEECGHEKEMEYFCYFGSIWKCNIDIIKNLILSCVSQKIPLLLKGRIFGISEVDKNFLFQFEKENIVILPFNYSNSYENSYEYLSSKYNIKIILSIQGTEHTNNYISNRVFENVSKGFLIATNTAITKKYFTSAVYEENLDLLLSKIQAIFSNEHERMNTTRGQLQEFRDNFFSFIIIEKLFHFLSKTIANEYLLVYDKDTSKNIYQVWFRSSDSSSTTPTGKFYIIQNDDDLRDVLVRKRDISISSDSLKYLDKHLVQQIITNFRYMVYIDKEDFPLRSSIVKLCEKNDVDYIPKEKLHTIIIISEESDDISTFIKRLEIYAIKAMFVYCPDKFEEVNCFKTLIESYKDLAHKYNKQILFLHYRYNIGAKKDIFFFDSDDSVIFIHNQDYNKVSNLNTNLWFLRDLLSKIKNVVSLSHADLKGILTTGDIETFLQEILVAFFPLDYNGEVEFNDNLHLSILKNYAYTF